MLFLLKYGFSLLLQISIFIIPFIGGQFSKVRYVNMSSNWHDILCKANLLFMISQFPVHILLEYAYLSNVYRGSLFLFILLQ
jgi:hypothetical protein